MSLAGSIDAERHAHVRDLLGIQESEARRWRDACLLYFQSFSQRPLPGGVEPPKESLEYHRNYKLHFVPGHPGDH